MDELNQIEEDLKKQSQEAKKSKHKVSGKSVFKLKQIMQEKSEIPQKEGNADSEESMAGDE